MNCPKCNKTLTQYTILSENGSEVSLLCVKCQAVQIRKLKESNAKVAENTLKKQMVPFRYINATLTKEFTNFNGSREVLDGMSGLYLIGESGIGKTYQLIAWMRYMILQGYKCNYVNWSDFLVQLRIDIKEYAMMKGGVLQADCIFIDDFDASSPYMYEIIYNFVNSMYNQGKLVFATGNELPTQSKLAMRFGEMTKQVKVVRP